MCVTFFFWDCLPDYLLFLVFNRDERLDRQGTAGSVEGQDAPGAMPATAQRAVHDRHHEKHRPPPRLYRPTLPAAAWEDVPGVIGGRDIEAGGTWLAAGPGAGRAAWLTTFREVRAGRVRGPVCKPPLSGRGHGAELAVARLPRRVGFGEAAGARASLERVVGERVAPTDGLPPLPMRALRGSTCSPGPAGLPHTPWRAQQRRTARELPAVHRPRSPRILGDHRRQGGSAGRGTSTTGLPR